MRAWHLLVLVAFLASSAGVVATPPVTPGMPPSRLFDTEFVVRGDATVGQNVTFVATLVAERDYSGEILLLVPAWVQVEPLGHNVTVSIGEQVRLEWQARAERGGAWAAGLVVPGQWYAFTLSQSSAHLLSGSSPRLSSLDLHELERTALRYNMTARPVGGDVVIRYREASAYPWATGLPQTLALSRVEHQDWGWTPQEPSKSWEGISDAAPSGSLTLPMQDGETVHVMASSVWMLWLDSWDSTYDVGLATCGTPVALTRTGDRVDVERLACESGEPSAIALEVPWDQVFTSDVVLPVPQECQAPCPDPDPTAPPAPPQSDARDSPALPPLAVGGAILMLAFWVRRSHAT